MSKVPFRDYDEAYFKASPRNGRNLITSKRYDVHVADSVKNLETHLNFQNGETILDIGSGLGHVAKVLCEKYNSKAYCCDVNSFLLSEAKNLCSQNSNMSFHLVKNDVNPLDFLSDNSINKAYAYAVFLHTDTSIIVNYLLSISRVLKKNGLFRFNYCNKKMPRTCGPNVIESDKPTIDSHIKELGLTVCLNTSISRSTKGEEYDNGWEAITTTVLLRK